MGIGAVDAVVGASPLCLQIQHAAVSNVKLSDRVCSYDTLRQDSQRGRELFSHAGGNNARDGGNVFSGFKSVKKCWKPLPFTDDAIVCLQEVHYLSRENGEPTPAKNDCSRGMFPDRIDQISIFLQK